MGTWLWQLATNNVALVIRRPSASSKSHFPVNLIGMNGVSAIYFWHLDLFKTLFSSEL
jgi:hypothetical protein